MHAWIAFTLLAALMQAVRTAGQKHLTSSITPASATLVRYLFGLPFVIVYFLFIHGDAAGNMVQAMFANPRFMFYATLASIAQIVATFLLVKVLSFRNFAVGTSFAKTEALQTAALGTVLFSASLSWIGWLAVLVGFIGIIFVSFPGRQQQWDFKNMMLGTLSGTAFSFTSLWLREASLSIGGTVIESASVTLLFMVSLQTVMCLLYSSVREPGELGRVMKRSRLAAFVGFTSAAGSVGWFTAMTYQNPALVKSLGQVEIVFTLLLTTLFFKERIKPMESIGVVAIVISVLLLLLAA